MKYPNKFKVRARVWNSRLTLTEVMLELIYILLINNAGVRWSCDISQFITHGQQYMDMSPAMI